MTEKNFNHQDFNAFNGNEYQGAHAVKVDHKKASKNRSFLYGVAGAALACVVGLGGLGVSQATADTEQGAQVQTIQLGAESTPIEGVQKSEDPTLAEAVAAKCLPSIVAIDVYMDTNAMMGNGYYMYGYGTESSMNNGEPNYQKAGLGSGVVMTEDGYIITNNHVVEDAGMLKVTIEGQEYDAEVIGTDPSSDVAVIKAIDASGLTPIELGDSDDLTIGEWVMTLGSPYGYEQSVATGIVSATSRSQIMNSATDYYGGSGERTIYPNMIQTDAAINPGNSGGALVNSDGALIGINTMITSNSGSYSGVGFAIPVNYAVSLAQQIIDGQAPTHAQLGVSLSTINAAAAERYGFPVDEGAYVAAVVPGSGAEAAGLVEGDIVISFDGQDVESADDLTLDVRSKQPGDVVTLTVVSNGETRDVEVTLGSDNNAQSASQSEEATEEAPEAVEPEQAPEDNGEAEAPEQAQPEQGQRPDRGQRPDGNQDQDPYGDEDGYGDGYGYGYGNPYGYGYGNGNDYGYGNGGSILDELLDLLQRR